MSRAILTASLAAAVTAGASHAQEPALTSGSIPVKRTSVGALQMPASACWYNGDLDFRNAFTSERNTAVTASWTFDDVAWPGGMVTGFRAHFLINPGTSVVAADLIIYQGMEEGVFGALVAERADVNKFTFEPINNWFEPPYLLVAELGGSAFNLPPGDYHVGIRCVGRGSGQAFACVTSGRNAVGSPPGNNGRSFLQSDYFGYPLPTDWRNLVGPGTWDVSYGLDCRPSDYTLALSGQCPGLVRVEWSGAEPDRRQGILFAFDVGNYTLPTGPCQGTELGLGTRGLMLIAVISTGAGSGAVSGATGSQCQHYAQLITISSCATSNVARVP